MKHCGDTDPKHRPHLWGKAHGMHVCPGSSFLDAQDAAQRDETPTAAGTDGRDAPEPAERPLHDQALQAIDLAMTQGGQAGIASGLAAIAYAILATTPEDPR